MPDDLLHVEGHSFDPDDLTYAEKRQIRRTIRNELWNEKVDGPFDWEEVTENDVLPATIYVFMLRHDPTYTLVRALALKPRDVYGEEVPPTSSPDASGPDLTEAFATSGTEV